MDKRCGGCGAKIGEGTAFCTMCGRSVSQSHMNGQQRLDKQDQQPVWVDRQSSCGHANKLREPASKSRHTNTLIIIGILTIILVVMGLINYAKQKKTLNDMYIPFGLNVSDNEIRDTFIERERVRAAVGTFGVTSFVGFFSDSLANTIGERLTNTSARRGAKLAQWYFVAREVINRLHDIEKKNKLTFEQELNKIDNDIRKLDERQSSIGEFAYRKSRENLDEEHSRVKMVIDLQDAAKKSYFAARDGDMGKAIVQGAIVEAFISIGALELANPDASGRR